MSIKVAFVCDGCGSMMLEPKEQVAVENLRTAMSDLVPRGWLLEFFSNDTSRLTCGGCQSAEQRRMFLRIEDGGAYLLPKGLVLQHG
jgi:hypothetical protein